MEVFLIYIAKSSLIIGLFTCCYFFFLQKETFFKANRWFLMGGIATSLFFPFIIIKKIIESTPLSDTNLIDVNATAHISQEIATSFNWWKIAFIIYTLGCIFFVIQFTIQLFSLYSLIKKGKHQKEKGYVIVKTEVETSPFSFFGYIVYNPKLQSKKELQTILAHEKVHLTQKHSIDTMLTHILCILQWANPFAWWYKKQVAQNLEYLADLNTATAMDSSKEYQYLLLQQSNHTLETISFTNTFFNSLIKKRIVMLNKNRSQKQRLIKMGAIVPMLAIALFMVNTKTVAQTEPDKTVLKTTKRFVAEISPSTTDKKLKAYSNALKEDNINLRFENIKRSPNGKIIAISSSFSSAEGSSGTMNAINNEKPITRFSFYFVKDDLGKIVEIGYRANPKEKQTVVGHAIEENHSAESILINATSGFAGEIPLYVVDGKIMDKSFDINTINNHDIEGISVYKGAGASKKIWQKSKTWCYRNYYKKVIQKKHCQ